MPGIKNNIVRERRTEETVSNGKENLEEEDLKNLHCDMGERILEKLIDLRNERARERRENQNITGNDSYFWIRLCVLRTRESLHVKNY